MVSGKAERNRKKRERKQQAVRTQPSLLPKWEVSPPLTPLTTLSTFVMTPPWNYGMTKPPGETRAALERHLIQPVSPFVSDSGLGCVEDLADTQHNVTFAGGLLEKAVADLCKVMIGRGVPPPPRLIVATKLVAHGAHHITAAHVLHVRNEPFYQATALTLARTGLELAARGAWVALGTGDEPHRIVEGPKLATEKARRAARPASGEMFAVAEAPFLSRWPGADRPSEVYAWLCGFTHYDANTIDLLWVDGGAPLREQAYAGTAYVAWFAATIAEIIFGQRGMPKRPNLPASSPWRAPVVDPAQATTATAPTT